jgi:hypothetical protein
MKLRNPKAMKPALISIVALLLAGCASAHLYPIQGPLAAKVPPPTYNVKMEYGDSISVVRGRGDNCDGVWLAVVKEDPAVRDLAAAWDLAYGNGYFLANILGHNGIARSTVTCPKGGTVEVEFNTTQGVAKDSDGNIFKLKF